MSLRSVPFLSVLCLFVLFLATACTNETAAPATTHAEAPAATASRPVAAEPAPAAAPDVPTGPTPVAGIDYAEIPDGHRYGAADDRIEVVEVFSYTCPHCARFEPLLLEWRARQPADVQFVPVAGPFGANPEPFVRAFFAAESLGVRARTHEAVFDALHVSGKLDPMRATPQTIAAFYAQAGVDPAQFVAAMGSPATNDAIRHATDFIIRSGVDGTPALVVDGKYRVTGKTMEDMLRIATHLVARERAARGG